MSEHTPGERSAAREGPQLTAREARAVANDEGTVRGEAPSHSADRDVTESPRGRDAEIAGGPAARGASGGTGNAHLGESAPDQRPFANSETALGGADSVEKTTWGVGHGAETRGSAEYAPVGLRKGEGSVVARTATGGGVSPVAWVTGVIAVIAAAIYAFGVLR